MQRALYVIADSEQTQIKIKENLGNVPVNIKNISLIDQQLSHVPWLSILRKIKGKYLELNSLMNLKMIMYY